MSKCKGCGVTYDAEIAAMGTYVNKDGVSLDTDPHQPCEHASCVFACKEGCEPELVKP